MGLAILQLCAADGSFAKCFTAAISAPVASYYGEVYDQSETSWTYADMGSGRRPATSGLSNGTTAYARDLKYLSIAGYARPSAAQLVYAVGNVDECYRQFIYQSTTSPWYRTLFYGGDGGEAAGCDPF